MTEQERYERIMETRRLLKNLYDAAEALRDFGLGQMVICKEENVTVDDISADLFFKGADKW